MFMSDLMVISFILLQIVITYLIGRVTMRIYNGEWKIDRDLHRFIVPYMIGVLVLIPILLIMIGIVRICL